jgi:hypothetical protein
MTTTIAAARIANEQKRAERPAAEVHALAGSHMSSTTAAELARHFLAVFVGPTHRSLPKK